MPAIAQKKSMAEMRQRVSDAKAKMTAAKLSGDMKAFDNAANEMFEACEELLDSLPEDEQLAEVIGAPFLNA